mmetsp:Transcript_10590/g.25821  ORF Transcript_10590/g.25821 Transcript_10590/m.25821 type:complete len:234 (-) Transcript_10590:1604-2305(-)
MRVQLYGTLEEDTHPSVQPSGQPEVLALRQRGVRRGLYGGVRFLNLRADVLCFHSFPLRVKLLEWVVPRLWFMITIVLRRAQCAREFTVKASRGDFAREARGNGKRGVVVFVEQRQLVVVEQRQRVLAQTRRGSVGRAFRRSLLRREQCAERSRRPLRRFALAPASRSTVSQLAQSRRQALVEHTVHRAPPSRELHAHAPQKIVLSASAQVSLDQASHELRRGSRAAGRLPLR